MTRKSPAQIEAELEAAREAARVTAAEAAVTDYLSLCEAWPGITGTYHPTLDSLVKITWCATAHERDLLAAAFIAACPDLAPSPRRDKKNARTAPGPELGQEQP